MKSYTTEGFWKFYYRLPKNIRERARKAHELFEQNPSHPGLNFEEVDEKEHIWSARVSLGYRVLGVRDGDEIIWFWIGKHNDYDNLI